MADGGDFNGPGFLGGIGGIVAGIASFLRGFGALTVKELLRLVQYLRDQLVSLSKQLLAAIWRSGKALARALAALGRLAFHGLKQFVLWADRKLKALELFLKAKFGPLLIWLKDLKKHIDDIYKRFVRPIIDTIEFIRQINRVLQLFHISVLQKLDTTLQQIEARIDEPFLWLRAHITIVENWINQIIEGDGVFKRVTLLKSMSRYAPEWINGFWNRQIDPNRKAGDDYARGRDYPLDEPFANGLELGRFFRHEDNRMQGKVDELVPLFFDALKAPSGFSG